MYGLVVRKRGVVLFGRLVQTERVVQGKADLVPLLMEFFYRDPKSAGRGVQE